MKTIYQPETFGEAVGLRLSSIREAEKINQIEAAKACGISQGTLSRIESGLLPLTMIQVVKLARLFGMPAKTLAVDLIKAAGSGGWD